MEYELLGYALDIWLCELYIRATFIAILGVKSENTLYQTVLTWLSLSQFFFLSKSKVGDLWSYIKTIVFFLNISPTILLSVNFTLPMLYYIPLFYCISSFRESIHIHIHLPLHHLCLHSQTRMHHTDTLYPCALPLQPREMLNCLVKQGNIVRRRMVECHFKMTQWLLHSLSFSMKHKNFMTVHFGVSSVHTWHTLAIYFYSLEPLPNQFENGFGKWRWRWPMSSTNFIAMQCSGLFDAVGTRNFIL